MIRIAITAAFATIERTLAVGTVAVEPQIDEKGKRLIWLEPHVVTKLGLLHGPGESYSDAEVNYGD